MVRKLYLELFKYITVFVSHIHNFRQSRLYQKHMENFRNECLLYKSKQRDRHKWVGTKAQAHKSDFV